ncbi:MAG TPA: hypothetical protein VLW52_15365 [Opitutaceae bacterium]|nr:hypothetical protein [Opitutaceae bacterium]
MATNTTPPISEAKPSKTARVLNWITNRFKSFRNCLRANKVFVEVIGLIVALAVLWTYRRANQLTEQALDLNRRQMMSSYVPWFSIEGPLFDAPKNRISFKITNVSGAPAIVKEIAAEYISKDKEHVGATNTRPDNIGPPRYIPPHQIYEFIKDWDPGDTPIGAIEELFWAQKLSVKITITYTDAFGRQFAIAIIADAGRNGPNEIMLSETTITGLDQLK